MNDWVAAYEVSRQIYAGIAKHLVFPPLFLSMWGRIPSVRTLCVFKYKLLTSSRGLTPPSGSSIRASLLCGPCNIRNDSASVGVVDECLRHFLFLVLIGSESTHRIADVWIAYILTSVMTFYKSHYA